MSSTSEVGHAKTLAIFKALIKYCQGYGAVYNPSSDQIKIDPMLLQLKAAEEAHADCLKKQTLFNNAVDARMHLFEGLVPMATRVTNALIASGAELNSIKSARSIMNKLRGKRVGKIEENPDPNQPLPETNSSSQRSIDKMIEHFTALFELVQSLNGYQPNESELQTASLLMYKTQLSDANDLVLQAKTDWSNARISRYGTMYVAKTGFSATSNLVKNYVKSIFGASSQQYKQLSALQFTKPAK